MHLRDALKKVFRLLCLSIRIEGKPLEGPDSPRDEYTEVDTRRAQADKLPRSIEPIPLGSREKATFILQILEDGPGGQLGRGTPLRTC